MKIKRILCPIDFSIYSTTANFFASLFADAAAAEIVFLVVNYPPSNEGSVEDELHELRKRLQREVRPIFAGVAHRFEVRSGSPAKEILKLGAQENVDLIVLGTHSPTSVDRLLQGSVCSKVLRKAKCPVMVVKNRPVLKASSPVNSDCQQASESGIQIFPSQLRRH